MVLEKFTQPPTDKVLYHNYFDSSRFKEKASGAEPEMMPCNRLALTYSAAPSATFQGGTKKRRFLREAPDTGSIGCSMK
jgi:hypothetical protein